MAKKKAQREKKHLALTVSLVGKMVEINRKGLLVLVFTVIGTLETTLAVTQITDSNFHSAIETCLGTNPVDGLCSSSEYGSMPGWDVSLVTNMNGWNGDKDTGSPIGFGGKTNFNGDITNWNTSQVNSMVYMFGDASAFNQDIGSWNTEKVTNMVYMFHDASAFNQDIGSWNTLQVTDMENMFDGASAFNQDISSWTGTAAMTAQSNMFFGATAFQAKYTCDDTITGPASSCDTIKSTWVAPSPPPSPPSPSPPPSSSPATTLTGLFGLLSACVVAFVLV